MDPTTYTENWRTYWEHQHDSGARMQIESAIRNPLRHWVLVDVPVLVDDEIDIPVEDIREYPDEILESARRGLETFAEDAEIDGRTESGYEFLSIHLVGVSQVNRGDQFGIDDWTSAANRLSYVPSARVVERPKSRLQPARTTYRCPAGHETTITHRPYSVDTIESCGDPACTNPVVVDDTETQTRWVCEFVVDIDGSEVRCVTTGNYAMSDTPRFDEAGQLHLTGILRLRTKTDGQIDPVYEVSYAGPA